MIFYILYSLVWLLSLLPWAWPGPWAACWGGYSSAWIKNTRRIVRDNLAPSFPDKDKAWVERTTRGVFEHIGMVAMEVPYLIRLKPETLMKRVRVHGREHIDRLIEQGSGFLIPPGISATGNGPA
jgi:lauroyl/myristoyl acyltransferase